MIRLSLVRQNDPLASASRQVEFLEQTNGRPRFEEVMIECGQWPLSASGIHVMQLNVGKLCNQTCRHCHVDAGPDRREVMTRETMQACLDALARSDIPVVDITGGAPELNPNFRWLVSESHRLGRHVIDRCNLTVLLVQGQQDLGEFLAARRVEVVASLPCYLAENVDAQRGDGVFDRSIRALRRLNDLGYGKADTGLVLTLVYNPIGPSLPPPQASLEAAYRRELLTGYGVEFTRLFALTNMPISRFLHDLSQSGQYEQYMQRLVEAFNPVAAGGVMCRTMLSVGWDGRLYDCDFNQMLELSVAGHLPRQIQDFRIEQFANRPIVTGQHCFGCTAGAGSSCQGAIL